MGLQHCAESAGGDREYKIRALFSCQFIEQTGCYRVG